MQRILHIVGGMDRAGAETMIMNLYRNIDRTQFQFDFLYFMDKKCDYDDEIIALGGKIILISETNPIKRTIKIYSFLKNNKEYQIIHSHTLFNTGFNLLAAKLAGANNRIAHSHNTSDNTISNIFVKSIYHTFSKSLLKKLSTTKIACGVEASKFLFDNEKSEILLNGIDIDQYHQIATIDQDYIRSHYSISTETKIILQVGRLQTVKNHKFSLDIMKGLKETGVDFKFFIIGQGNLENELKSKVEQLGLKNHVIFTGIRSDVPQLMAGADIMLMPSFHEGFPVVLVESQAIGLPTIVSDKVSQEVDLGLNLIQFTSLDNINSWINNIVKEKKKNIISNKTILKEKGFDVKSNATWLQQLYKKMN